MRPNREILVCSYILAGMFALLIGYFVFFQAVRSDDYARSSYNVARQDANASRVMRGKILSREGHILAETREDEDGEEYRSYPYGAVFAHAVGYSTKGKIGLESWANDYLMDSHAPVTQQIEEQLKGQKSRGDNVITTLSVPLQQAAYDAMGDREGAVILMKPGTGEILAMVSKADFDPNQIDEIWYDLTSEESGQSNLFNRAVYGLYPPGSTFKILMALEYMRENPTSYSRSFYTCDGTFTYDGMTIHCASGGVHGKCDLKGAFAHSCNSIFAQIGIGLDWSEMTKLCKSYFFNQSLPTDIPHSKSQFVLSDELPSWEKLQTSIGQGQTLMTPLHSVMIAAAVANDGVLMEPYIIDQIGNADNKLVKRFSPVEYGRLMTVIEARTLKEYMRAVVAEGTGSALYSELYTAYGKTGSAQYDVSGENSHAWFTGFAEMNGEQIAIVVVVEGGGSGGDVAVPIARTILDAWAQL